MAQEHTTDERLMGLMDDDAVFKAAMEGELCADLDRAEPFMARAKERFGGRRGVCLSHLCNMITAASEREGPGAFGGGLLVRVSLARLGGQGATAAAQTMALGYALALADLAAVPPDGEAVTGS